MFVGKPEPEEKRPSGRYGRRLQGGIHEEDGNVDGEMW
jgi:hypothetical protein